MDSQASLSRTWNTLRETKTKYESLQVDAAEWKRRANDATIFTSQRQLLLKKLQKDMADAMDADKEMIESLQEEVSEWTRMATDSEEALEKSQNEHAQTRIAMQECAQSLENALSREEALQKQNAELRGFIQNLQQEVDEERRLKDEALAAAAMALRATCQAIDESAVAEVDELKDNSHHLMELLAKERDVHQTQFDLLKDKYQAHLSLLQQEATEDKARIKGKISHNIATIMAKAHEERDQLQKELEEAYERIFDVSKYNETLVEIIEDMKKEHHSLQKDNDYLQQQLNEKLQAIKKVQEQFEMLQSEFNALLRESRALKKDNAKISSFQNCVVYALTGSTEVLKPATSCAENAFIGTTPKHLRKEFELKVKSMVDEKRTLVTRSNAAIADMHKAKQQAWEADQKVAMLKKELRMAKLAKSDLQLALQSKGIDVGESMVGVSSSSSSFGDDRKENVEFTGKSSPLDVTLLINDRSHDIEAIPLSSSSSSMAIPPPPPPPSSSKELSVKVKTSSNDQLTVLSPSMMHGASAASGNVGRTPQLSLLLGKMTLGDKNSAFYPTTTGQGVTILSPSSKDNRRVHWNEKRLWVADDGSKPLTPLSITSPINDRYVSSMASPSEHGGFTPLAPPSNQCTNMLWTCRG